MSFEFEFLPSEVTTVPAYLAQAYWWAYVHPLAVRVFERQWLVNLILWGNFKRLRDAALEALGATLPGRTLQVACVYGDLSACLAQRVAPGGTLDVLDVLPIQLENLARKLPAGAPVRLLHADAAATGLPAGSYDRALVFFLLHEQPDSVRRATLLETMRVLKPGGTLAIVDYHRPAVLNPLRYLMPPLLARLEPFALDLWRAELARWLPAGLARGARKLTHFGGLYQTLVVTR